MRLPRVHRVWRVGDHWCVVADNTMFWLGYTSVPEGHPWYELDWEEIPADAHGGITFANHRDWAEFQSDDGVPPAFYVGFDCGHFCCTPIPGALFAERWPTYPSSSSFGHPPWTIETVVAEVNRLAVQAQVAAVVATA
jgi:hypothetical protein